MISLDEMKQLADALKDAESETEKAELKLKEVKERERMIREETIPSAMQELGLESITLDTGEKLSVKQEVYASIPAAGKSKAYAWLSENGFGGLVKVSVELQFGKGEQEEAVALTSELRERGLEVLAYEDVHASTLKAFLKEQISKGANIPLDLFGARPVWQAKISKK